MPPKLPNGSLPPMELLNVLHLEAAYELAKVL